MPWPGERLKLQAPGISMLCLTHFCTLGICLCVCLAVRPSTSVLTFVQGLAPPSDTCANKTLPLPLWVILLRTKPTTRTESEQNREQELSIFRTFNRILFWGNCWKAHMNFKLRSPEAAAGVGVFSGGRFFWAAYVWVPLNNAVFSSILSAEQRYQLNFQLQIKLNFSCDI